MSDLTTATAPPDSAPASSDDGRGETQLERCDRNLTELMGELRVAMPGVQVLFAFLLVAPFDKRLVSITPFEQKLYFATLLLTLLASILLIAPTTIHRLHFRRGERAYIVRTANRLTILGLAVFAVAMTSAIALVTHYLFSATAAIVTGVGAALAFVMIWGLVPIRRFSGA